MISLTVSQFGWMMGLIGFGAGIILMMIFKHFWDFEVVEK